MTFALPSLVVVRLCQWTAPLLLSATVLAADAPVPTASDAKGTATTVSTNITVVNSNSTPITASAPATNTVVAPKVAPANTGTVSLARSNTPAPAAKRIGPITFENFAMIVPRNIFNPDRRAPRATDRVDPPPVQVDTFALVGVMSYEKGQFAFFDGSSSGFRQALKVGGKIDTYTVTEITNNKVKLKVGETNLDFSIGMQMRREDKGAWKMGIRSDTYASTSSGGSSSSSSTTSSSGGSSGGGDSLAERMRKRREEEGKK